MDHTLRKVTLLFFFCLLFQNVFGQYHNIDSLTNLLNTKTDTAQIKILLAIGEQFRKINLDSAEKWVHKALKASRYHRHEFGLWKSHIELGRISYLKKDIDLAATLQYTQEALVIAQKQKDKKREGIALAQLGLAYTRKGEVAKGLEYAIEALNLFKQVNDKFNIALQLNRIALCYSESEDLLKAIEITKECLMVYAELNRQEHVAMMNVNLGRYHRKLKRPEEAVHYFEKALTIAEPLKHDENQIAGAALNGLGLCYFEMHDVNKAELFFIRAQEYYAQREDYHGLMITHKNLGNINFEKKDFSAAIKEYEKALTISEKENHRYSQVEYLPEIYEKLSRACVSLNDYERAYFAQLNHIKFKDLLNEKSNFEKINELQAKYDSETTKNQLLTTLKEKERLRYSNYALIFITILIISLFLLLYTQYKKNKIQQELDAINERDALRASLGEKEISEQMLKDELDYKSTQLASYTLHSIQKNEMLEELKTQIEALRSGADSETNRKLNRIAHTIQHSHRTDKDWENFRQYFDQIHAGFFDNLKANFPYLNNNDLKLCALLKMNLETKQIAALLDITPDSAKIARYRLRKKLGLETETNINDFLNKFCCEKKHIAFNPITHIDNVVNNGQVKELSHA